MLKPRDSYEAVYNTFKWKIPKYYNMGVDVCDKHAHQRYRLALIYENEEGRIEKYTFWQLKRLTNQFANTLQAFGFGRGDRLGILLPQCPETGISHIAAYKIGGIAIPLFTLFGPEALEYRLANLLQERCGGVLAGLGLDSPLVHGAVWRLKYDRFGFFFCILAITPVIKSFDVNNWEFTRPSNSNPNSRF